MTMRGACCAGTTANSATESTANFAKDIIFKGAIVQGINGRKMFETWFQMEALLATGKLNLEPAITHRLKLSEFHKAMELLQSGEAIKVVMRPE